MYSEKNAPRMALFRFSSIDWDAAERAPAASVAKVADVTVMAFPSL
ncbi:MAG: hypothetical protein PGN33_18515 [Methylobacterium radiotolerans]